MVLLFAAVGGQLIRLALKGQVTISSSMSAPLATSYARPDIVDRNGRLLAVDIEMPSLFADAGLVLDRDVVTEKLLTVFPDLNEGSLRRDLSDRSKRFIWVRRGLAPRVAQRVHDLGLPGLAFQRELRRAFPAGTLAGHVLGTVDLDNKGLTGFERYIDQTGAADPVVGATQTTQPPIVLSIDVGVQHGLEVELDDAMRSYRAAGAAGLVLDVHTGEVLASASYPAVDPIRPSEAQDRARADKIAAGTYELGSIFKAMTVAMMLDDGAVSLDTMLDVREPLIAGRYTITDLHPAGRPLSVADVFLKSSNVGAGMLALQAGPERQKSFLEKAGLIGTMRTEAGAIAAPQEPQHWNRTESITISYGHGLAVAPLQFASAAAALVNGGQRVKPTFLKTRPGNGASGEVQVIKPETSAKLRELMWRNVKEPGGTARRADAAGYRVGGKTGTAEIAVRGGYRKSAVISSFFGVFPMEAPKYLTLVMIFEPQPSQENGGEVTAGVTAAPTTAKLVNRIAPLLGVLPEPAVH